MADVGEAEGGSGYGLVYPFVVCSSKGGPYEDGAFTAGWQAGRVDAVLGVLASAGAAGYRATVYTQLVAQLELVAMHHGFPHVRVNAVTATGFPPDHFAEWVDWSCSRDPFPQPGPERERLDHSH